MFITNRSKKKIINNQKTFPHYMLILKGTKSITKIKITIKLKMYLNNELERESIKEFTTDLPYCTEVEPKQSNTGYLDILY